MGILGTAVTGINAAQLGLLTTEHNISNANTPGYSRQRIVQTTNAPVFTGAGFVGQGTRVVTIERQYNAFVAAQVNQSQANASELEKYSAQIALIDNILADPTAGLSPAMQDFFRGVQQVTADPSSLPSRQALVSSAQALVARFQGLESRLSEIYDGVDTQISGSVDGINSMAVQIGEINQRILVATAGSLQAPNDLLDQRDQLITELNKFVRVQVVNDPTGALNVFIGNGQQLVVGSSVGQLAVLTSPDDGSRLVIGLKTPIGTQILPETTFTGGDLGGLVRFRSETLDTATNQLGQVAASLTLTFNAQHALGQDLLGQIAGDTGFAADFFSALTPITISNRNNTGGSTINAAYVAPTLGAGGLYTNLTASDYQLLADGTGGFTLTRLSDNKVWGAPPAALGSATAPFTVGTLNSILANPADPAYDPQGFTLDELVPGTAAANDTFLIQPTRNAARNFDLNTSIASDVRLIAAAGPIRAQPAATNTGSGKVVSTSVGADFLATTASGMPITLTYDAATTSLAGFPPGTSVTLTNAGAQNGTYPIAALATQVPYRSGATITINDPAATPPTTPATVAHALSLQIDGLLTTGDQFVVERNVQGVADARNMLTMGQLQTQNTMAGQTTTYQGSYAKLVSDIGNRARSINVTRDAQQKLLEQATATRESESGVNLDEEAAKLIEFQQAYQAAAKSLDIASRLFDEILALGR